jgi:hypothetical protein
MMNSALKGGAIHIDCIKEETKCNSSIENTHFQGNMAMDQGGAISYHGYRPMVTNNTFMNNSALYGKDIASYPAYIAIDLKGKSLSDLASGQLSKVTFEARLMDFDD